MAKKTDQQRFDAAMAYLRTVNAGLADDVTRKITSQVEAGKDCSLEGEGYWHSGDNAQHNAVRALILCQKAYLTPPYFKGFFIGFEKQKTKQHYKGKTEQQVQNAIKCYLPGNPRPNGQDLVTAARLVNETSGNFDFYTLNRESRNLGANPICFAAVRMWLFKAGFVSIKWLASSGFDLTANSANQILGDGVIKPLDQLDTIPSGHVFNFHAPTSKPTCHWGLSIGGGRAIAANTTQQCLKSVRVNFAPGSSVYGEFPLAESYDACKWKYAREDDLKQERDTGVLPEITIRDIDPTLVNSYF
jgi:hypothetical protein